MNPDRKVTLYIAMSLDGYIAKPDDDLSFLALVEKEGEDYGYTEFVSSVDMVIVGRKTYDWVMKNVPEFPHADKTAYIVTRTPRPSKGSTHFYNGDLKALVSRLKSEPGKTIFIDGGAELVNALLQERLIDEFIISVIPVLLGNGKRLFNGQFPEQALELLGTKSFEKGLAQLHYKVAAHIPAPYL